MNRFVASALLVVCTGCVTTPPEQDPTVQQLTALDGRLLRIERILSNQALLEQSQRVEALYNEVRALRGQVETMQHAHETSTSQQRERYADLDKRLQAMEARGVAGAAPAENDEAEAYREARDLLKNGKYGEAAAAFKQFIATYPQSAQAADAHYWLAESRFMNKEYGAALTNYKTVTTRFADSYNVPNAWLKIGDCHYEQKNWQEARDAYKRAGELGAGTPVAKSAEQRLAKLQAEKK